MTAPTGVSVKLDDSAVCVSIVDVVDAGVSADHPARRASILCIVHHQRRPNRLSVQPLHIFTVVAEAVLGDLDRVEVALVTPLIRQRYT